MAARLRSGASFDQFGDTGNGIPVMKTATQSAKLKAQNSKVGRMFLFIREPPLQFWVLSFGLCVLSCRSVEASMSQLKEGNRQFKNGHYDEALKLYEDALIDTPYSSILHFNAGDATMMKGEFPKAEVSF